MNHGGCSVEVAERCSSSEELRAKIRQERPRSLGYVRLAGEDGIVKVVENLELAGRETSW